MKHPFYKRQKGFTLLELLVVITLLAVLAVGALVAYEGVGDNAGATAAANNTATVDRAVRTYKAVEFKYPDQWDNLANNAAAGGAFSTDIAATDSAEDADAWISRNTALTFGSWNFSGANATVKGDVEDAFEEVGIEEVQSLTQAQATTAKTNKVLPNLVHNEGSGSGADEFIFGPTTASDTQVTQVSVVAAGTGCQAGGQSIADNFATTAPTLTDASTYLNKVNDALDIDTCHLVVALGFGNDAAASTTGTKAPIVSAATYTSRLVNPANTYGRYVGLFHLGSASTSGAADVTDINDKAVLIGFIDPEGKTLEENRAAATAN